MADNEPTMIVKFTEDYEVKDEHAGTDKATRYTKGQRKSFPERSAMHFINRKLAVPHQRAGKSRAKAKG